MVKKIFIILAIFLNFSMFFQTSFAGAPAPLAGDFFKENKNDLIVETKIEGENIMDSNFTKNFIPNLFKLAFFIGGPLAVLAFCYAGFLMMTSFGESDKYYKGLKIIGITIGGILTMLFSRAIIGIIESLNIGNGETAGGSKYSEGQLGEHIKNLPSGELETQIIPQIITIFVELISFILVGIIIYAGIIYISPGLESKKENGKALFFDAFIGLIFIIFAYAIASAVFKFNILSG